MKVLLPGLIAFALWSILCVRWYVCGIHEQCGNRNSNETEISSSENGSESPEGEEITSPLAAPLSFDWSGFQPAIGEDFQSYLDSVKAIFDEDPASVVQVTGLYDPQEINNSSLENLGLARAQSVKELLLENGIKRNINITSRTEDLSSGFGDRIANGVTYSLVPSKALNRFSVTREEGKLIIHFPSNSKDPQRDNGVMQELKRLVKTAGEQGQTILVTGHTDNHGEPEKNKILGLIRAVSIQQILIESGMPEAKVLVDSEGEEQPMASNTTELGRQLNRRVELVVI